MHYRFSSFFLQSLNSTFHLIYLGTCHILNGGCEEICIPEMTGRRCECDIGLQIQPDQSCDSGENLFDLTQTDCYFHDIKF